MEILETGVAAACEVGEESLLVNLRRLPIVYRLGLEKCLEKSIKDQNKNCLQTVYEMYLNSIQYIGIHVSIS